MAENYIDPTRTAFDAFKALPRDEPVEMLNLVRFRDWADYPPDHPCAAQNLSGADSYRLYSKESGPVFERVGGSIIWSAAPKLVLIGAEDESWDLAFVARYPSASAFLAMVTDEDYRRAVIHRQAGVATSRLVRTLPRETGSKGFG